MTAINDLVTAGEFFLIITAELVLLFLAVSFFVGLIQEYVPEEKIRRTLSTRHRVTGTAVGAFFGALTPFCSCSTIPLLVGLINSKVPFGACMAFLFASPLLNPIIVFLILAFLGPSLTLMYCIMTFSIAVLAGLFLERRNYLRFVKPVIAGRQNNSTAAQSAVGCSCASGSVPVAPVTCCQETTSPPPVIPGCCEDTSPAPVTCCSENTSLSTVASSPEISSTGLKLVTGGCSCGSETVPNPEGSPESREGSDTSIHRTRFWSASRFALSLFRQVLPYLILGAAIGAFIYGFVPEDLIVGIAGPDNPLAIPVAAVIGIPMYIRAETIIPISAVLLAKGMGIGAVMALIIGGAGASIPEVTLLASIFERRLVAAFVITILGVAVITGVAFQIIQVSGIIA
jgi:hypothetical protein